MALTATPTIQREAEATAGVAARLVSASALVLALWLFSAVVGDADAFWWPFVAWGGGVVLSFALPQTRELFASISGVVVGLIVVAGLLALFVGFAAVVSVPVEPPGHLLLLALVPPGLDWHRVVRLRARVLASGFLLMVLVGIDGADTWATRDGGGALVTAMAWFGVALAALWLLHRDQIGALPRPAPLGGGASDRPPPAAADFLLVALVSALVAVVVALVVAGPGCMPWQPCARNDPPDLGDLSAGPQWPGDWGSVTPGGGAGTGSDAGYFYDEEGRAYAYHPGTGTYLRVPRGDAYGYDPGSGYHYDGDGRAYRYDAPTDTYRRDPGGDDAVPDPGGDRFFKDRDGRTWIPGENGKPLPPGVEPSDGQLLDGIVRDGVIIEGEGPVRILPPDADLEGLDGRSPDADADDGETDLGTFAKVLVALVVLVGLVALGIWWWRRDDHDDPVAEPSTTSPDRPWAEAMVRRMVAVGARHGRARLAGESVEVYAAQLARGPVDDPRLAKAGIVVSIALFGAEELPVDHREWVEGVLDQIDAADAAAGDEPAATGASVSG